jgi:hypothetical protein
MSWPTALVVLSLLQFLPVSLAAWWAVRETAIPVLVYVLAFWPCAIGAGLGIAAALLAGRARSRALAWEAGFALVSAAGLFSVTAFILARFHAV